ncbi:unnamed protein product, partial [Ectocarpus sp. 8 AP-2014]
MSMMGPSDLSEVEDEVKVIQQNFRAWILRCNYKSLRKAAKTLQRPTEDERATREERAAKALQAAARVMLARKGRFQR